VQISSPVNSSRDFDDVSGIYLMADFDPPTAEPSCITLDEGRRCHMSVGKKLMVAVYFRSAADGRIKERTKLVAKDVAETENVIKQ
jgi:hypothetical protein